MGYFDGLAAASFKRDREGRPLFFPWGVLGRGYELPDEGEHQRVRKVLIRICQAALLLAVLLPITTRLWVPAALALPFLGLYFVWVRRTTRGLRPSPERLTFGEAHENQARHMSRWLLWVLLASSGLFVAAGVFLMVADPRARLASLPGILFFGFCSFVFVRMLRAKRSAAPRSHAA